MTNAFRRRPADRLASFTYRIRSTFRDYRQVVARVRPQKPSYETHFVLGRHPAKELKDKDCPSWERGDSSFRRHGLHNWAFAEERKMPWKECNQMDERLKFIARLLDGEKMAAVCRDFNVSRKTGYKILTRYNDIGLDGLTDRSRRPYRHANQLPVQIETRIVRLKQDKPSWGAPKIREKLARLYPDVHTPAISTVHAVLDRHGLVKRRMARRNRAKGTALSLPGQPNDLWCADYKGEFILADRRYCYPLTRRLRLVPPLDRSEDCRFSATRAFAGCHTCCLVG